MSRPAPRVSYTRDVVALSKLVLVIEMDRSQSVEWRQEVIYHLNEAIGNLQQASVEAIDRSHSRKRDQERAAEKAAERLARGGRAAEEAARAARRAAGEAGEAEAGEKKAAGGE